MEEQAKKLLEIQHLKQYFPVAGGKLFEKKYVKAVDDVSFFIRKGQTLGLVMNRPPEGLSTMMRSFSIPAMCRGRMKPESLSLTEQAIRCLVKRRASICFRIDAGCRLSFRILMQAWTPA